MEHLQAEVELSPQALPKAKLYLTLGGSQNEFLY